MTAVPPPVPPEIVRRAAEEIYLTRDPADWQLFAAEEALAAVYGDIVEAARRDALTEAVEAVEAHADQAQHKADDLHLTGMYATARIVTDLRDATAPRTAPAATVGDQDAVPRIPRTDEAQIGVQSDD